MNEERAEKYFLLAAFALIVVLGFVGCWLLRSTPTLTAPSPSASMSASSSAPIPAPPAPRVDAGIADDGRKPVQDLAAIKGRWESSSGAAWAVISERGEQKTPYPWRLELWPWLANPPHGNDTKPYECGFFPDVHPPDWRVGYCRGAHLEDDAGRYAVRIVFRLSKGDDKLYVQVGDWDEIELSVKK